MKLALIDNEDILVLLMDTSDDAMTDTDDDANDTDG